MNFRELYAFTRRSLHGNYRRALAVSLSYGTAWLVLKLIPWLLAGILIANGTLTQRSLLLGSPGRWVMFSMLWAFLRFCLLLPLRCRTCAWFTALSGLERRCRRKCFFPDAAAYLQAIRYFGCVALLRLFAMLPLALGVLGTILAFRYSLEAADAGLPLFAAVQCLLLSAAGLVYYLRFQIGIAAVPFLFLEQPDGSPFAAVRSALRMLHGRQAQLLLLILGYLPAVLPVVTIPCLLPHLLTSTTLFLQICMREWEQRKEEESHANIVFSHGTPGALQA